MTLMAAAAALLSFACTARSASGPVIGSLPIAAWPASSLLRGIGISPKTPLSLADYEALDVLRPGSVVVYSTQLGDRDPLRWLGNDPELQRWLRAHQDVTPIVRMWPVRGPDDPRRLAQRIVMLHARYPWIVWFEIANEPDIEWADASWNGIASWASDVWWSVERYRRTQPVASDIRLLFPPLAQASPLDPENVGYDAMKNVVELYLDHGDGIAGHEYWDRDKVYLVEESWPAWLRERLASAPFFVTECGRRPLPTNGWPDESLGYELLQFTQRTRAHVVAPFVLSSPGGSFDQYDFVDRRGVSRPHLFIWGALGP
ncbi:MAG TPA: hypothetical protein VFB50_14340 [Chloroflexota bacterium]|nr:hypothetical protein [Chloroflexota bacterium]